MDTLVAALPTFDMAEPIPGYKLQQRLGAGGYGEVWRSEAPGGLLKAVKIVHGPLGEVRAERELKALQRIRLVQHPLLLSLERFEVVDQHLVIVTELAHGSLRDRFRQRVEEGLRGIPRGELLTYLRDVAEGLDYLYEQHSLQHLDVKPENLLLVADRVKVADFGLVKDLLDQSVSLIGGLTPLYAAPELFDGRPSRHSDQYSLAMVYQELLTGEPPFQGRTLAQLAAQHLHGQPCLDVLPRSDQPILARALAKDPQRRFGTCRELISKLTEAPRASLRSRRGSPALTDTVKHAPIANRSTTAIETRRPIPLPQPNDVRALPPVALETPWRGKATLIVGLGQTGAVTLRKLRSRLVERFGSVPPAFEMLLLDTDWRTLAEAASGDPSTALPHSQTICLPLRSSQAYREDSKALLEWLNRRWLYNIPRSLQTEGIRPLGRLAFVDHFALIAERLRQSLGQCVRKESLTTSAELLGTTLAFGAPQVFVVASACGGAGGGMVLDLGYTLHLICKQLQLTEAQLHGLLLFSTPRRTGGRDLAVANGLCLLNELRHYLSPHGYPGEPACQLPAYAAGQGPFNHTYLMHLGDDLGEDGWAARLSLVAEYLYQNLATPAAAFFDACRGEPSTLSPDVASVRTCGISALGGGEAVLDRQVEALSAALIDYWVGNSATPAVATELGGLQQAATFQQQADLDPQRLDDWANELMLSQFGGDPRLFLRRLILEARARVKGTPSDSGEAVSRRLGAEIDAALFGTDRPGGSCLLSSLQTRVEPLLREKALRLRDWVHGLLDAPQGRLAGAQRSVRCLQDRLSRSVQELQAQSAHWDQMAPPLPVAEDDEALAKFATIRLRQLACRLALKLLRGMITEVGQWRERLQEFSHQFRQLLPATATAAQHGERGGVLGEACSEPCPLPHPDLVRQLDAEFSEFMSQQNYSWSSLLDPRSDAWQQTLQWWKPAVRRACRSAAIRIQINTLLSGSGSVADPCSPQAWSVEEVQPPLRACGGAERFLIVGPEPPEGAPTWQGPLEKALAAPATTVAHRDLELAICCEVQDVPLANVAAYLARGRDDLLKIADRVHTRIDVDWPV